MTGNNDRLSVVCVSSAIDISHLDHSAWNDAEPVGVGTYWSGEPVAPGRRFEFKSLWSDADLYFRFDAEQHEPLVVNPDPDFTKKTMDLWNRDVCELFIAPDKNHPQRYAEFEIAPTGEWLDLMVDWRKDEPRDWTFDSEIRTAVRIEKDRVLMAFSVPWSSFDRKPTAGDVWLGNVFRQVGSGETRGYLAWQPTMTEKPNFHVPEAFGEFHFIR